MNNIPKDKNLDSTLSLMLEGFPFIYNRCRRYGSNIFETRLLMQKTVCLHGEEAAKVFYDTTKFKRKGAAPKRVQKTLFGEKGVQTLDGEAHRHRKAAFMSLMTRDNIQLLMVMLENHWRLYSHKWETVDGLVLYDEVQELLCRAASKWAGVPMQESEVKNRAKDYGLMVDAFGAVGPRHLRGRLARSRAENWMKGIVKQIRSGQLTPDPGTAAHLFSWHQDLDGKLLPTKVAAVEIINIIRPIVAIARYITFSALAMHEHPEYRQKLQTGEEDMVDLFAHEVRRYYPFGPFLGARVKEDFEWSGYHFPKNRLVLLDIWGTNRDEKQWEQPHRFWPERFRNWNGSPFNFIPQGGGDFMANHRCAGEWITIEVMKQGINHLANRIKYEVPEQDLGFSLVRMPTIPRSRFIIKNVTVK
ncbi:cytochrome P450 [Cesiribacter sp. SM1]|uniref:cytochrome P450 n=1 Tax=Cesiribacter sp. SM1 TaxID=2861196 RepID=UPI001CD4ED4E|nr:cytochrome P450 [Cesiribacter sp. SM1]